MSAALQRRGPVSFICRLHDPDQRPRPILSGRLVAFHIELVPKWLSPTNAQVPTSRLSSDLLPFNGCRIHLPATGAASSRSYPTSMFGYILVVLGATFSQFFSLNRPGSFSGVSISWHAGLVMRHRPFSRRRSATCPHRSVLVERRNCTVASWSQSVTGSTPFLGFSIRPFAAFIQIQNKIEVVLQFSTRLLFDERSSRLILVERRSRCDLKDPLFQVRPVTSIHFSFRVVLF